jgi:hypothetical protein
MGVEKRLPGGLPLATRGRLNAVFFQGAAHGCIREGIPEVGQGALDAVATPGRVFACQPHHQGADLAVIPLLGHEQAASTQSALRCSPPAAFRDPQWLPYTTRGRQDRWRGFFRAGRAEAPGGEEGQKQSNSSPNSLECLPQLR